MLKSFYHFKFYYQIYRKCKQKHRFMGNKVYIYISCVFMHIMVSVKLSVAKRCQGFCLHREWSICVHIIYDTEALKFFFMIFFFLWFINDGICNIERLQNHSATDTHNSLTWYAWFLKGSCISSFMEFLRKIKLNDYKNV